MPAEQCSGNGGFSKSNPAGGSSGRPVSIRRRVRTVDPPYGRPWGHPCNAARGLFARNIGPADLAIAGEADRRRARGAILMKVLEWQSDQTAVFHFQERRLDAINAPQMRDTLIRSIERGMTRIILDLQEVRFMDSTALGACISGAQRIGPLGRVVLAGARGDVKRLLDLTHMHLVFDLHPSLADATRTQDSLVSVVAGVARRAE